MSVSQTRALQQEVNALREQVLDLGEAVTDLTTQTAAWRRVCGADYEAVESWIASFREALLDAGPDAAQFDPGELKERPALHVIRGGAT